jgi:hypothetical protein
MSDMYDYDEYSDLSAEESREEERRMKERLAILLLGEELKKLRGDRHDSLV